MAGFELADFEEFRTKFLGLMYKIPLELLIIAPRKLVVSWKIWRNGILAVFCFFFQATGTPHLLHLALKELGTETFSASFGEFVFFYPQKEYAMRKKILWCGLAMCFVGCAGNKDLLSASISEAEGMGRAAKTEKIQSAAVVQGDSELAIARQLAEEGKSDAAWDAAERSRLQYRLAFAEQEAKETALADSSAARELKGDEELQKWYQSVLENETQGKEAAQ